MNELAIIVGINLKGLQDLDYELNELANLCEACNIKICDRCTQNIKEINKATYIGKGKINEIKELAAYHNCDCIVCNDELTPAQISNLQSILDLPVYDRTYIILEIFKRRSQTKEAYLQVEIARLKYMLPRLSGMRTGFSRIGGGAQTKGSGETQLELDRRHIQEKITQLKKELENVRLIRQSQRVKRNSNNMKIVSLVGYTNSGKSSMLNALLSYSSLEKKEVMEKDMLFATLETSTRAIRLENNHQFLLTDTVGFVEKLPHYLVEAFKSTLEEILESDLILHVVDASNPNFERQIKTTNQVLAELGVKDLKCIYLFNKIDKVDDYLYIPNEYPNSLRVSAKEKINLDQVIKEIDKELFKDIFIKVIIPYTSGDLVNQIVANYQVLKMEYTNEGTYIEANVSEIMANKLQQYIN